mmetsp:Transcript_7680/g.21860  ORF Transcript_7680/g.21860 Transcript_7680/m.21860 type:complete len:248 (+) Transcript_7680:187-930(+)
MGDGAGGGGRKGRGTGKGSTCVEGEGEGEGGGVHPNSISQLNHPCRVAAICSRHHCCKANRRQFCIRAHTVESFISSACASASSCLSLSSCTPRWTSRVDLSSSPSLFFTATSLSTSLSCSSARVSAILAHDSSRLLNRLFMLSRTSFRPSANPLSIFWTPFSSTCSLARMGAPPLEAADPFSEPWSLRAEEKLIGSTLSSSSACLLTSLGSRSAKKSAFSAISARSGGFREAERRDPAGDGCTGKT